MNKLKAKQNEKAKVWIVEVTQNEDEQTIYPNFTEPVGRKVVENIADMQYDKVLNVEPY